MFENLGSGISRLKIPFENIYTSVFLLREGNKSILIDSGNSARDAEKFIIPALRKIGTRPDIILLSHLHGDHSGGAEALLGYFPEAKLGMGDSSRSYGKNTLHFNDGDVLLGRFMLLNLKGHTPNSMAVFDLKEKILISADCLQLYGVGRYGTNFSNYGEYIDSMNRVRKIAPESIIASHAYEPCGFKASGGREVENYINSCIEAVEKIKSFAVIHSELSAAAAARLFNKESSLPPISEEVINACKKHLKEG